MFVADIPPRYVKGKNITAYIIDAFDHKWVRTPGSIDIMFDAFGQLAGAYPSSKSQVIEGVAWKFTGRRSPQYEYLGVGLKAVAILPDVNPCSANMDCQSFCCSSHGQVRSFHRDITVDDILIRRFVSIVLISR